MGGAPYLLHPRVETEGRDSKPKQCSALHTHRHGMVRYHYAEDQRVHSIYQYSQELSSKVAMGVGG